MTVSLGGGEQVDLKGWLPPNQNHTQTLSQYSISFIAFPPCNSHTYVYVVQFLLMGCVCTNQLITHTPVLNQEFPLHEVHKNTFNSTMHLSLPSDSNNEQHGQLVPLLVDVMKVDQNCFVKEHQQHNKDIR